MNNLLLDGLELNGLINLQLQWCCWAIYILYTYLFFYYTFPGTLFQVFISLTKIYFHLAESRM